MREAEPKRLVVFGVTGHLGQQLVEKIAEGDWPIGELIGVASAGSAGAEFEFRGEFLDVVSEWPVLKGRDLVFICTPPAEALEIVREALRAEVPCVDCTGALGNQPDVPMPSPTDLSAAAADGDHLDEWSNAPLLEIPSGTSLAWAPVLEALSVSRVVGTVLCSASALGQNGVSALSGESIALFNQVDEPELGPAAQAVAFDVIPGSGIDCERVRSDLSRLLGRELRLDLASVLVPTFVGEGASLALELSDPANRETVEACLEATEGITIVRDGLGSRGLVAVEGDLAAPIGPTLRDTIGSDEILIGRVEPDSSLPVGVGWRLWLAFDPLRLTADHALRLARRRLGLG
jgi:aspartate-semialdehyde dehydrogenase